MDRRGVGGRGEAIRFREAPKNREEGRRDKAGRREVERGKADWLGEAGNRREEGRRGDEAGRRGGKKDEGQCMG